MSLMMVSPFFWANQRDSQIRLLPSGRCCMVNFSLIGSRYVFRLANPDMVSQSTETDSKDSGERAGPCHRESGLLLN